MKKNYSLLLLLPLIFGCQDRLAVQGFGNSPADAQSSVDLVATVQLDAPLTFVSQTDFTAWTSIRGIEERFKACDVPEAQLKMMTTSALVRSVLHYPLNYLVFAYNDPQDAVRLVYENSGLHRELASRSDAAEELIKAFSASSMTLDSRKVNAAEDNRTLSYTDGMFLEYFLGSGLVPDLSSGANKTALREAVRKKLELRSADILTYSANSLRPLFGIDSQENLQIVTSVNGGEFAGYQTVYTRGQKPIVGIEKTEFSSQEIEYLNDKVQTQYPNAILRGPASARYNCHSYAWHDSSTSNTLWINAVYEGFLQLSNYWTDDLYVSCSSTVGALKAYYSDGDHSANILSSGKYLSKWGAAPLMEHDYDDCPYETADLQFYNERQANISGDTWIMPNTTHLYTVRPIYSTLTYQWEVAYMDNLSSTPGTCTWTRIDDHTYWLEPYEYGLYKIRVRVYNGDHELVMGQLDVICAGVPSPTVKIDKDEE